MQESLLMLGTEPEDGLVDGVKFLGEVPTVGFINGTELASAIGLTAGTAQHTDEPWLHFELDGKILYVAKRPYRHSISWNQIHACGAVFGTRTIELNGDTYKVRLLKGADVDPTPVTAGWNPVGTHTSEWNRLLYKVHNGLSNSPWPLYSDRDLVTHSSGGNGSRSLCQETDANDTSRRVYHGSNGISYFNFNTSSFASTNMGWRPVLELVP